MLLRERRRQARLRPPRTRRSLLRTQPVNPGLPPRRSRLQHLQRGLRASPARNPPGTEPETEQGTPVLLRKLWSRGCQRRAVLPRMWAVLLSRPMPPLRIFRFRNKILRRLPGLRLQPASGQHVLRARGRTGKACGPCRAPACMDLDHRGSRTGCINLRHVVGPLT